MGQHAPTQIVQFHQLVQKTSTITDKDFFAITRWYSKSLPKQVNIFSLSPVGIDTMFQHKYIVQYHQLVQQTSTNTCIHIGQYHLLVQQTIYDWWLNITSSTRLRPMQSPDDALSLSSSTFEFREQHWRTYLPSIVSSCMFWKFIFTRSPLIPENTYKQFAAGG